MGSIRLFDQFQRLETVPTEDDNPASGSFGKIEAGAETLVTDLVSEPARSLVELRELSFRVACITGDPGTPPPDLPIRLEFFVSHRGSDYPLDYASVPGGFDVRAGAKEVSMKISRQNIVGILVHSYNIAFAHGKSVLLEPGERLTMKARRHLTAPGEDPLVESFLYYGPLYFVLECMGLDVMQITPRRARRRRGTLMGGEPDVYVLEEEYRLDD